MKQRWSALRFMLSLMWESDRRLFLGHVLVNIAGVGASLLFAVGIRPLIDGAVNASRADVVVGGVLCAAALALLIAIPVAQRSFMARSIEVLIMVLQRRLLSMSTTAPGLEQFEEAAFWDKLQLLKRNFGDVLMGLMGVFVGPLIAVQLIVAAVVLFGIEPWLILLPLVVIPVLWLHQLATKYEQRTETTVSSTRRAVSQTFESATDADAAKDIRVFGLRHDLLRRHRVHAGEVTAATDRSRRASFLLQSLGHLLVLAAFVSGVLLTVNEAVRGNLSVGDVALTLSMASVLIGAANATAGMSSLVLKAVTLSMSHETVVDHIQRSTAALATENPKPLAENDAGVLRLQHVTFSYPGTNRRALDDISLELPAGGVVALVGENGAGKTTLVKTLLRMYPVSSGNLTLNDQDVTQLDLPAYRARVSASFQDFVRFQLTAGDSVRIGDLTNPNHKHLLDTLDAAECGFVHKLPAGLDTQLGTDWEGGVGLSGGQWQRLAIGRTMLRQAPLLVVYDEPTAGLDPQSEYAIFRRIADLAREDPAAARTITLLVSHRFSTVRMADLIVVLERGKIIQQGSHDDLITQPGLYQDLFELQAHSYR